MRLPAALVSGNTASVNQQFGVPEGRPFQDSRGNASSRVLQAVFRTLRRNHRLV